MVKYAPIKFAYYWWTHIWIRWLTLGLLATWIGIDFTEPIDWGDHPTSNGHWSALPIVLIVTYIGSALGTVIGAAADFDFDHYDRYKWLVRNSKFNDRNERVLAKAEQDRVNIYRVTDGVRGKNKQLLSSYDVTNDLEATDRAIEFAAQARAELKARKAEEKAQKKYVNREAESLARVINKG